MSQIERIYGIHRQLAANRAPTMQQLMARFEAARATIRRDIDYMQDRLQAPVIFDRARGGYIYQAVDGEPPYELPGFWLTAGEIRAICLLDDLLNQLQAGILAEPLQPVRKRLQSLLKELPGAGRRLRGMVRLMSTGARPVEPSCFRTVATALAEARQLSIDYTSRGRNERGTRTVSPCQLVHHRGVWYVVAWCHKRTELRSFSLDAINSAAVCDQAAIETPAADLQAFLGRGFGVFSGPVIGTARMRFSREHARWVRHELWHPEQKSVVDSEGSLVLEVPYTHEQEIMMEILRHGADVEVLGPAALRRRVQRELERAAAAYAPAKPAASTSSAAAMIR